MTRVKGKEMGNLISGVITLVLCVSGYLWAYRLYRIHRLSTALLLIMACGLLLRVYAASDLYLHQWDERYHALVAKNLIEQPLRPSLYDTPLLPYDFKDWTGNHIWVHKQPVPLWTMALSMAAFGTNELALRLPSVVLSTLGIWIAFFIASYLFNKRVGLITAFLFSIHGLIIELTAGRVATDHVDVFFLFFIQLAVLLAIQFVQSKHWVYNMLCGVSIGLAILSKWLPAFIVLPVWVLLVLDSREIPAREILKHFAVLCFFMFLTFIPWQVYIFHAFPAEAQWESSFNFRHFTEVLEQHSGPVYYHFDRARILFGELIYLPLGWFLWKTVKRPGNFKRLVVALWVFIPFFFFSLAKTKMQGYTLFAAPGIFMITGLFWHYLYRYRNKFRFRWMVVGILIFLLALPARYSIERIKPFMIRERNPQWAKELRALDGVLGDKQDVVVFNAERPVETMFYTDCIAYPDIPKTNVLQGLLVQGFTILIREQDVSGHEQISAGQDQMMMKWGNTGYWLYGKGFDGPDQPTGFPGGR